LTELAYLPTIDAAYLRRFNARVTALPPGGVVLDRTLFYPVGGGQPADHGTLQRGSDPPVPVVDVTKSGSHVIHRLRRKSGGGATWALGDEVTGEIDWDRRHRHMRLHTAQHLLSALLFARTGLRTRDALFGQDRGRIDLERSLPAEPALDAIFGEANTLLASGLPVRIREVPRAVWDRAPAPRSGLVSLPRQIDPVRVIEIAEVDVCPCGGTHVRSTAEVGTVSAEPVVPIPGGVRVPFRLSEGGGTPTPSG
jgi:misacylated tRNA(Ala) deacylase